VTAAGRGKRLLARGRADARPSRCSAMNLKSSFRTAEYGSWGHSPSKSCRLCARAARNQVSQVSQVKK